MGIQVEMCDHHSIGITGNREEGTLLRRSVGADAITGVGANEPQYPQGAALPGKP
jgi:hypothetical protein